MYRCEICGVVPAAGVALNYVVTERRAKRYAHRVKAHPVRIKGKKRALRLDDSGGIGWEIVRQAKACARCAEEHVMPEPTPLPAEPEPIVEDVEGYEGDEAAAPA